MEVLNNLNQESPVVMGVGDICLVGSITELHLGCNVLQDTSYRLQANVWGYVVHTTIVYKRYHGILTRKKSSRLLLEKTTTVITF